jgi:spore germination protein PE
MLSRTSHVQKLEITTSSLASVIQIGDSKIINGLTRALAIQREAELFFANEGNFAAFPIFNEPIPLPYLQENVTFYKTDITPCIRVPHIKVRGVSSSSVVHIGNSNQVYMESRVKHIRQLLEDENKDE